jgi:hypothetical protein
LRANRPDPYNYIIYSCGKNVSPWKGGRGVDPRKNIRGALFKTRYLLLLALYGGKPS